MFDNARPADIITFLQRIDSTVLAGRTPIDAWREFLKKNGGGSGSLNDMEDNWLNARSASLSGKKGDKVATYLHSKGYTGAEGDKIRRYLRESATQ